MVGLLKSIADIFLALWDAICGLIGFVVDFVADLVDLIVMATESVVTAGELISVCVPPGVVGLLLSILAVVLLYVILGRK